MCMLGNTDQTIEEDAKLVDDSRVACAALQHSAYRVVTCTELTLFHADVRLQAASILCKFDRVQFHTLPESHCSGFASMLDQLLLSAGLFKLQELLISTLQVFAKHSAACTDKLSVLQARYAPLEINEHASYVARLLGESKILGVKSQSARKLLAALNAGDVSSRVLSLRPLTQTNFGEQCVWGSRRDHLGWFDFNLSTIDMNYDLGNQQTCRRELFLDTELESGVVVEPDDGELELRAGLSPVVSGAREAGRYYWVRFFATPVAIPLEPVPKDLSIAFCVDAAEVETIADRIFPALPESWRPVLLRLLDEQRAPAKVLERAARKQSVSSVSLPVGSGAPARSSGSAGSSGKGGGASIGAGAVLLAGAGVKSPAPRMQRDFEPPSTVGSAPRTPAPATDAGASKVSATKGLAAGVGSGADGSGSGAKWSVLKLAAVRSGGAKGGSGWIGAAAMPRLSKLAVSGGAAPSAATTSLGRKMSTTSLALAVGLGRTPPPSSFNVSQSALSDVSETEDHVTAQEQLTVAEREKKASPPPSKPAPLSPPSKPAPPSSEHDTQPLPAEDMGAPMDETEPPLDTADEHAIDDTPAAEEAPAHGAVEGAAEADELEDSKQALEDLLERIHSLKLAELRAELTRAGLDTKGGREAVLAERLQEHLRSKLAALEAADGELMAQQQDEEVDEKAQEPAMVDRVAMERDEESSCPRGGQGHRIALSAALSCQVDQAATAHEQQRQANEAAEAAEEAAERAEVEVVAVRLARAARSTRASAALGPPRPAAPALPPKLAPPSYEQTAAAERSHVQLTPLQLVLKMWNAMTIPLHKYAAPLFSTMPALKNRLAPPIHGAHEDKIAEVSRCESGPQPVSEVCLIAPNECPS